MPIYDTDDELSRTSSFSGSHDRMEQFEVNHRREYGHGQGDGKDKLWNGHSVGITSSSAYTDATEEEDDSDNTGGNDNGKSKEEKQDELAARETQYVIMSKIGVVVVLIIFTFIFGMATYWSTSQQQINNFESRFEDFATQIVGMSEVRIRHIHETFHSLSIQMTSFALGTATDSNGNWPLVSLPRFGGQMDEALRQSSARLGFIAPLVDNANRAQWEEYAKSQAPTWIKEGLNDGGSGSDAAAEAADLIASVSPFIFNSTTTFPRVPAAPLSSGDNDDKQYYYAPIWQIAPVINYTGLVNYDAFTFEYFSTAYHRMEPFQGEAVLSEVINHATAGFDEELNSTVWPESFLLVPVMDDLSTPPRFDDGLVSADGNFTVVDTKDTFTNKIRAVITALIPWDVYFTDIIPEEVYGIIMVIRNTCGQEFTVQVNGPEIEYLGAEDLHDWRHDALEIQDNFTVTFTDIEDCHYTIHIFPSDEFREQFENVGPIIYAGFVVFVFVLTAGVFVLYDWLSERRTGVVMASATRSNAIVSSLFPAAVRERLMTRDSGDHTTGSDGGVGSEEVDGMMMTQEEILNTKPIADLFTDCTVLFSDICGFTAWSSEREPSEVFTLLEYVYNSFDRIARRMDVFKVETIGDCYLAVTGLPNPCEDHAVKMSSFARACLSTMTEVLHSLELILGPGTSELGMRFGLHSGPVTAGVLRGDKSRFQLFGDTVNTAARMESSGQKNRIHISPSTMESLVEQGRGHWVKPRNGTVTLKGKGEMQTYWVKTSSRNPPASATEHSPNNTSGISDAPATAITDNFSDVSSSTSSQDMEGDDGNLSTGGLSGQGDKSSEEKQRRLVVWNVQMLSKLLKKIVAMREEKDELKRTPSTMFAGLLNSFQPPSEEPVYLPDVTEGKTVLDEVQEIITLPTEPAKYKQDPDSVELPEDVVEQLTSYVTEIAKMYRDNPFHSFDHASHVTQSVIKMLSRVVAVHTVDYGNMTYKNIHDNHEQYHDNTYGITSDPLTQFACAFSALIHDLDHPGVPNQQLVKEGTEMAKYYKNKSVAEQNSLDLAWGLLMEPQYKALRACIYRDQSELTRFRQLLVNSLMATDISDKELGQLRKERWNKAFDLNESSSSSDETETDPISDVNRKATIVIEHLIQASDVAHTMQHWNVYIKWNEKLFHEMYQAYLSGRAEKDPSESWYQGELGFYDFYIIPLAKKLDQCGVFGVSSDEFLNYAKENRQEWEKKGRDIVATYLEKYNTPDSPKDEKGQYVEQENEQFPDQAEHGSEFNGGTYDNRDYGSYSGDQFNYSPHHQPNGENYNYSTYQRQYDGEQQNYSEYQYGYTRDYQGQYSSEPYRHYPEHGRQ